MEKQIDSSHMTDQQLVEQILLGNNRQAFEELVNRYQPLVVKTCRGFVASYADAEDLAQDVFIEAFQSLPGFRNDSKLSTWLYRIAVNKSLNFVRKQNRKGIIQSIESFFSGKNSQTQSMEIEDSSSNNPEKTIILRENKQILKSAINNLPENQRIAFILSKYQDLSYKEIAEVMDVSLPAVESLLFRAKANLQKQLMTKF